MKMRFAAAFALAAVTFAGTAGAQDTTTRPGRDGRGARMGRAHEELGLTEQQRTQIRALHQRYAAERSQLRESLGPQMEAARDARQRGDTAALRALREQMRPTHERLRALQERQRTEMRALLTEEQRTRLDARRSAMRERMESRRGRGGRKGGMRGDRGRRPMGEKTPARPQS